MVSLARAVHPVQVCCQPTKKWSEYGKITKTEIAVAVMEKHRNQFKEKLIHEETLTAYRLMDQHDSVEAQTMILNDEEEGESNDTTFLEDQLHSEADTMVQFLAPEILDKIFHLLSGQDLKSVVQVCRLWREVGERPGLWTWVVARATGGNMGQVLGARRMLLVRGLRLQGGQTGSGDLLEPLRRHRGLEGLEVTGPVLSCLSSSLLTRAIAGLEEVKLSHQAVCSHQAEALFTAVPVEAKLRKLSISLTVLSSVSPGLLARAASCLQELSLASSQLTSQQAETILVAVGQNTRLKKLDLSDNSSLRWISPSLLARAVTSLEEVRFRRLRLDIEQLAVILAAIGRDTRIKKLDLNGSSSLEFVEPDLLARAASWLEEMNIGHVTMTKPQIRAIFTAIAGPTKLKTLMIGKDLKLNFIVQSFNSWITSCPIESSVMHMTQLRRNLANVKKDSVLEIESLARLRWAMTFGIFQFNLEADRLKMI